MVPLNEAVGRLEFLAKELNDKTDDLNEIFLEIEERLQKAQVGVTYWLDQRIVSRSGKRDGCYSGWVIGYARIGSEWRLAAKPVAVREGLYDNDPDCPYTDVDDAGEPMPLAKASRAVRVEAAEHLEELITWIAEKVSRFIRNIENAKKFTE